MRCRMKVVDEPINEPSEQTVEVSRVPVLGEYVRSDEDWYQVKRVVHLANGGGADAELFVVSIVDPAREPLRLSEWLEPSPQE